MVDHARTDRALLWRFLGDFGAFYSGADSRAVSGGFLNQRQQAFIDAFEPIMRRQRIGRGEFDDLNRLFQAPMALFGGEYRGSLVF